MVKKIFCSLLFFTIIFICGMSVASNAAETPVLDVTPYSNAIPRNDFFANGTQITISAKEGGGATITWAGGTMDVAAETRIFGGGNEGKSYATSNVIMNGGTVSHIYGGGRGSISESSNVDTAKITINGGTISKSLYGGGLLSSQVKNTKIVITGGQIANVNGGGSASEKTSVGTEAAPQNSPCIVNNAQIDVNGGIISTCLYGGGQGYSYTKNAVMNISGTANISGWMTAGGSNGRTDNATVNIKGGTVNVFQTINRGSMIGANVTVTGGTIAKLYAGGETGDSGVKGRFLSNGEILVDIKGGTVVGLFTGTNGGTVIAANSDFLKLFYKTDSVGNKEIITNSFGTSAKAYVSENTIKEELTQPITVGKDVFNALSTTGASYIVSMPKYSWEFSGNNITNSNIDVDLQINVTQNVPDIIKSDVEKLISDGTEVMFLNFSHHGQLPGKAKIQIDVSESYSNGTKLYIAHYNETTKKLEDSKEVVVENGKIIFEITSCSSYTLSKVNLLAAKEDVKKETEKTVKTNSEKKIEKDTTPKTGINDNMKIPMIIISLAVLGIVALRCKRRK